MNLTPELKIECVTQIDSDIFRPIDIPIVTLKRTNQRSVNGKESKTNIDRAAPLVQYHQHIHADEEILYEVLLHKP